jgi:hypothetical protein
MMIKSNESVLNYFIENTSENENEGKFNLFNSFYNLFKGRYYPSYIQKGCPIDSRFIKADTFNNNQNYLLTKPNKILDNPQIHSVISENVINQHQQNLIIHQTDTQLFSINNPNNPLGIIYSSLESTQPRVDLNFYLTDNISQNIIDYQAGIQETINFINLLLGVI